MQNSQVLHFYGWAAQMPMAFFALDAKEVPEFLIFNHRLTSRS
jgi:hypothetical protein